MHPGRPRVYSLDSMPWSLHVPIPPQGFQAAATFLVLRPSRAFGDIGELPGLELQDDVVHVASIGVHRIGAGVAAQGTEALAVALIVVERDRRYLLPADVFPDVELSRVEQRVNPQVGTRREIRLVLVPKLRRLVSDVPLRLRRAGREVPLLGTAT